MGGDVSQFWVFNSTSEDIYAAVKEERSVLIEKMSKGSIQASYAGLYISGKASGGASYETSKKYAWNELLQSGFVKIGPEQDMKFETGIDSIRFLTIFSVQHSLICHNYRIPKKDKAVVVMHKGYNEFYKDLDAAGRTAGIERMWAKNESKNKKKRKQLVLDQENKWKKYMDVNKYDQNDDYDNKSQSVYNKNNSYATKYGSENDNNNHESNYSNQARYNNNNPNANNDTSKHSNPKKSWKVAMEQANNKNIQDAIFEAEKAENNTLKYSNYNYDWDAMKF